MCSPGSRRVRAPDYMCVHRTACSCPVVQAAEATVGKACACVRRIRVPAKMRPPSAVAQLPAAGER
jgi:hypothetical protein